MITERCPVSGISFSVNKWLECDNGEWIESHITIGTIKSLFNLIRSLHRENEELKEEIALIISELKTTAVEAMKENRVDMSDDQYTTPKMRRFLALIK